MLGCFLITSRVGCQYYDVDDVDECYDVDEYN